MVAASARPVATSANCIASPVISRRRRRRRGGRPRRGRASPVPNPCAVSCVARYAIVASSPSPRTEVATQRGADVVGVDVRVEPERQHAFAERQVGHAARTVPRVVVDHVEQGAQRGEPRCAAGRRRPRATRAAPTRLPLPRCGCRERPRRCPPRDRRRGRRTSRACQPVHRVGGVPFLFGQAFDEVGEGVVLGQGSGGRRGCGRAL